MVTLDIETVEKEIIALVNDLNENLKIGAAVDQNCCPGTAGFASQILLNVIFELEERLGVVIPNNQYIFHDKATHKQLSITEAAKKLIKVAKNGN